MDAKALAEKPEEGMFSALNLFGTPTGATKFFLEVDCQKPLDP